MKRLAPLLLLLALPACAGTPSLPKRTLIPIPVPCEVEQVPETDLPVAPKGANVAQLAAYAAAVIELLKAENTRLRAANDGPCPTDLPEGVRK